MGQRVEHEVAHHFESAHQEFETSKLGMWLFLVTEILMFGGLFVGYTILRGWYPETWDVCADILSTPVGATNTAILLLSSFTMVASVWAAQTDRQGLLKAMLALTFVCAGAFMCIKLGYEWPHEFQKGIRPVNKPVDGIPVDEAGIKAYYEHYYPNNPEFIEQSAVQELFLDEGRDPQQVPVFFGLYFTMTGIHGLHVLVGMGLIGWLYIRSTRGEFYPGYFTPVELVGLYWHIVDLIWIFLFPLFYLI